MAEGKVASHKETRIAAYPDPIEAHALLSPAYQSTDLIRRPRLNGPSAKITLKLELGRKCLLGICRPSLQQ